VDSAVLRAVVELLLPVTVDKIDSKIRLVRFRSDLLSAQAASRTMAETDVPNGLLAALGGTEFQPFGIDRPIRAGDRRPLVIITTNEERALPDAFVRRCIVHFMDVPDTTEDELVSYLVNRGTHHFPTVAGEVLREAAVLLYKDRTDAKRHQLKPYPGQAEFLDLIRAVRDQTQDRGEQSALLKRISKFALKKNRGVSA
jgi:hypothetical protein